MNFIDRLVICIVVVFAAYVYHQNMYFKRIFDDLVQKTQHHDQALTDLASWKKDLDGVQNKLPTMEKTLSDMTSWKKSLDDVKNKLQAVEKTLSDMTSWKERLDDEVCTTTHTLRGQMDQLSSVKRSMEDLALQAIQLALDVALAVTENQGHHAT